MTKLRALLVEDDQAFARLLRERLLAVDDLEITLVADSLENAIMLAREHAASLDLAVVDLALPDSDGVSTIGDLHHAVPRLPLVVLSGQRDVSVALEAMRHGAQDYILKSASEPNVLSRAAKLAVERKRLQDTEQMLIGVVSHDLRGPLQTIHLACEMLLIAAGDHQRPALERAQRAAQRATSLVNDLLDATRARLAGVLPIDAASIDVAHVVEHVVEEFRQRHPNRSIDLELAGETSAIADPKRLSQLLENLLGNAIQHSPSSSKVAVSLRGDHSTIALQVENAGKPIPPELQDRIFEPLERAEAAKSDPTHSVGLGLFIAREIVKAHGGTIDVTSSSATGLTRFSVSLPIRPRPTVYDRV